MNKEQIFTEALKENRDNIFRICCGYTNSDVDRKDLFQEILINVWKGLSGFRHKSALNTWIYRIAVNTCLLHIRKEERANKHFDELQQTMQHEHAIYYDDQEILLKKLHECIYQLPELDRLIISLVLEEISYKEIADITGKTVNHVGVKIKRIKDQLAKKMEAQK